MYIKKQKKKIKKERKLTDCKQKLYLVFLFVSYNMFGLKVTFAKKKFRSFHKNIP